VTRARRRSGPIIGATEENIRIVRGCWFIPPRDTHDEKVSQTKKY
jgi:hypothetical protein